jgi:hypothetical protein
LILVEISSTNLFQCSFNLEFQFISTFFKQEFQFISTYFNIRFQHISSISTHFLAKIHWKDLKYIFISTDFEPEFLEISTYFDFNPFFQQISTE